MLKWLKGAELPIKKAKTDKKDYMKSYEDVRTRTFNEKWKVDSHIGKERPVTGCVSMKRHN